jgi:hypothetical protein
MMAISCQPLPAMASFSFLHELQKKHSVVANKRICFIFLCYFDFSLQKYGFFLNLCHIRDAILEPRHFDELLPDGRRR